MTALTPLFHEVFRATNEDAPTLVTAHLEALGYDPERGENYVYAPGSIPVCLVAHTDTVHRRAPETIYYDPAQSVVWSPTGLGADDRAGVYAILTLLDMGYRPHVLFPDLEETGGTGAKEASLYLCPSVHCLIELDRMEDNDAAVYQCSSRSWNRYLRKRGWNTVRGTYTDIVDLMPSFGVCGVNFSVGYHNQHTTSEYLRLDTLSQTITRVAKILTHPPLRSFVYHEETPIFLRDTLALDLDKDSDAWRQYGFDLHSEPLRVNKRDR